jgi:hypothetical protein
MASEHWTDGATENSLSQPDGGLRRCSCGGYFLSDYAERVGFIPKKARAKLAKLSEEEQDLCRLKFSLIGIL